MASSAEVLGYLIPNGGYVQTGETYEGIEFLECKPITKAEYEAGFAQYDTWKTEQESTKATQRQAILNRLGLTEDEARLLLG